MITRTDPVINFFLCGLDVFVVFQAKNNRKKAF